MTRPTDADINNLANRTQNKGVSAVLLTENQKPPYVDLGAVKGLVSRIHSKMVVLPDSMSEAEKRTDVVAFFDHVYEELAAALK